jgi:hypothetical protein
MPTLSPGLSSGGLIGLDRPWAIDFSAQREDSDAPIVPTAENCKNRRREATA